MSSQSRINAYMERHRLGPLFEDLMNKVLRDMPEEPMVYLIRTMYKKAGMEIPQGIRYGGLRKSTDLSRSPERPVRSAQVSSSTDAASRDYNRPWAASPTRKMKVRKSEDLSGKQKPEWNPDVKMKTSVFDEFWETKDDAGAGSKDKTTTAASRKSPTKQLTSTPASAWASVGVLDANEAYTSPAFSRPHGHRSMSAVTEKELLASEAVRPSLRTESSLEYSNSALAGKHGRGPRLEAQKHRQEMARALKEADRNSDDSGVGQDLVGADDPDAIELLEDADDLQREGVRNIPKSGYKLSKAMRYRKNEPRVKLSLNLNPDRASVTQWQDSSSMYDYHNASLQSSPEQAISDEEFESVSQVSGPRQPVWKVPDVERDFPSSRPSYSKQVPLVSNTHRKNFTEQTLSTPNPDPFRSQTVTNAEDLNTYKSWTAGPNAAARVSFDDQPTSRPMSSRSVLSETDSGGWMVPEDTEVASAMDWNQRVKGGKRQDPRSY